MGNDSDMAVGGKGASLIESVHNGKNIILILYFEKLYLIIHTFTTVVIRVIPMDLYNLNFKNII